MAIRNHVEYRSLCFLARRAAFDGTTSPGLIHLHTVAP